MKYEIVELEEKMVVGVNARTDNNDPECIKIIGGLWQKFMGENVAQRIEGKTSEHPIGLYSDYDKSFYDVTIGMQVSSYSGDEFTSKIIPAGRYAKFTVVGDVVKAVGDAWNEIWAMPLDRSFAADFEEYVSGDSSSTDAVINIYVALK